MSLCCTPVYTSLSSFKGIKTPAKNLNLNRTTMENRKEIYNRERVLARARAKAIIDGRRDEQMKRLKRFAQITEYVNNLDAGDIRNKGRYRKYVDARKMFWKLAYEYPDNVLSLTDVGSFTGHDHATVIFSIRQCDQHIETDKEFAKKFKQVKDEVDGVSKVFGKVEMFP